MVKVLQIGMTRNIGGLETYLMQQFDNIDKTKITYDFVNITGEYDIVYRDKIERAGSKIYSVCSRHINPIKHYWQWLKLLSKIGKRYKAIVLNSNSLEYVFPLFAAKLCGVPTRIMHSHNSGYEHEIGIVRMLLVKFNSLLLKLSATDYFACSIKAGEWMFGKDASFKVIHNAIKTDKFAFDKEKRKQIRHDLGLEGKLVVGHVGRFTYQKNHKFLIDCFYELTKIKTEAVLMLVGDYTDDASFWVNAKKQVKDYGIEDKVLFLGMRKDVPDLMQAMDLFILPSRFEGLPLVGIEAQAIGLPCLFSDNITQELKIMDNVKYCSLEDGSKAWVKCITETCNSLAEDNRAKYNKLLKEAGYDIDIEIKKIEAFYLK